MGRPRKYEHGTGYCGTAIDTRLADAFDRLLKNRGQSKAFVVTQFVTDFLESNGVDVSRLLESAPDAVQSIVEAAAVPTSGVSTSRS